MRELSNDFKAHLDSRATTLCYIWTLTRRDGVVFGFTDHDRDLNIADVIYKAQSGLSPGASEHRLGFSVDNGRVDGVLSDGRMSADDIRAGLYDEARLDCARVNWRDPNQRALLRRGYIGDIMLSGSHYEIEWVGEGSRLNHSQGRVFSRQCDAEFGDRRCGLSLSDFPEGTQCDRRYSTCRDRFQNSFNFRGFPYLLGDDALLAGAPLGEPREGGSRYNEDAL